jgi:peptide deformylase
MGAAALDDLVEIHGVLLGVTRRRLDDCARGARPLRITRRSPKSSAMKRPILIHPDPRLKKVCEPVPDLSDDLRQLADDMLETMYDAPGIGLAAPQVGVTRRLIVLDCVKDEGEAPRPLVMFNPEVVARSDETNTYEEGCLSIPDQYADVTRPKLVDVRWIDRDGNPQAETFDGLWATCVQHEIDHLNGKLFIDYLGTMRRQMITRRMQKLKREQARA